MSASLFSVTWQTLGSLARCVQQFVPEQFGAVWYTSRLLVELTPKGVVLSFLPEKSHWLGDAGQKMAAAFELLTRTLQDMVHTEGKLEQVDGLLHSMHVHRRLIVPVAASSGIRCGHPFLTAV